MFGLIALASGLFLVFILAGNQADDLTREASIAANERVQFVARSTKSAGKGPMESRITDTVMNHETDGRSVFLWRVDKVAAFAGRVPAGTKEKGKVVPAVRTQQYNTFRPVLLRDARVALDLNDPNKSDTIFAASLWRTDPNAGKAVKGAELYGKLIAGEEKGKTLLTFTSTIQGEGSGSLAYKYTATNSSDSPVEFEWAGFKEKLEPGKSFSRTLKSAKLTAEVSETAAVSFKDRSRYTITANVWQRPE